MTYIPTHYEVLGLPESTPDDLSPQGLRAAYRRALLRHHPDKANASGTSRGHVGGGDGDGQWNGYGKEKEKGKGLYSIDQISVAFSVLSDARQRASYDAALRMRRRLLHGGGEDVGGVGNDGEREFRTGVEVVDLDDLERDEEAGVWYRACRCGEERGFLVCEPDLEEVESVGGCEVVVGCRGCSSLVEGTVWCCRGGGRGGSTRCRRG